MRQNCFVMTMRGVIVKSNYPYVGDHPAEPPSITSMCDHCDDLGVIALPGLTSHIACPHCAPDEPDPEPEIYPD